jgi:hypothetical protein
LSSHPSALDSALELHVICGTAAIVPRAVPPAPSFQEHPAPRASLRTQQRRTDALFRSELDDDAPGDIRLAPAVTVRTVDSTSTYEETMTNRIHFGSCIWMKMLFLLSWLAWSFALAEVGMGQIGGESKVIHTGLSGKGSKFAVSPDGARLVFNTGNWTDGLRQLDLRTGKIDAVAMEPGRIWEMPSWSQDGKQVVAVSTAIRDNRYVVGEMQVILLDPTTWKHRTVTAGDGVKVFPFFSGDGKSVYYFKGTKRESGKTPASRYDLYAVSLGDGQEQRLTQEEFYEVDRGDDDGKAILFDAIPRVNSIPEAYRSKSRPGLYRYDRSAGKLAPMAIDQSSGVFYFTCPERDNKGSVFFVAAKLRPGGGNYQWFLFRATSAGTSPVALTELPIDANFDLARRTGEIFVMGKQGEEIVFRRLPVLADH